MTTPNLKTTSNGDSLKNEPNINKAFVGLGSCDNVQTKRSFFKYAKWPRLQIKRTGLVSPADLSSWSIQLVHPAGLSS